MAVRAGGEGDVTKTHVVWRGTDRSRIATPIYDEGRLYWINSHIANCTDAATGKQVYQSPRLGNPTAAAGPVPGKGPEQSKGPERGKGPKTGGGYGKRGGGRGTPEYSSPVLADGKIYWFARSGEAFVYAVGPEFKLLGQNSLAADGGDFSSTPAVSDGALFIRSSKYLYCIQ